MTALFEFLRHEFLNLATICDDLAHGVFSSELTLLTGTAFLLWLLLPLFYFGLHFHSWIAPLFTSRKSEPKDDIIDDNLEKKYVTRVVYIYPPNKERHHSKYVDEIEGPAARFSYSHYEPFQKHGILWYITSDYISPCKGTGGKTELRVIDVQPIPSPENLEKFKGWARKITPITKIKTWQKHS